MNKVKFYGVGGQGIVTAARLLCHSICMYENKYAKIIPAYGHERRGAPVFSDIVIDDKSILMNSFIYEPDVVIVFDPNIVEQGVDIEKGIHSDTVLIINSTQIPNLNKLHFKTIYYVNATDISKEKIGNEIPNIPMLGALAKANFVQLDSLCKSIEDFFKNKKHKIFVDMIKEGYDETKRI